MKNSLVLNYSTTPNEINYGTLLFKNAIEFSQEDVEEFIETLSSSKELYESIKDKEKNVLWNIFKSQEKEWFIKDIQKVFLNTLAKYCDYYPESIHSLQWQERTTAVIELSGMGEYVYNPSSSKINENGYIENSPFSRQLVAELYIENSSDGDDFSWLYFDSEVAKIEQGDLIIYPANFLWSRKQSSIIAGRRIFLRTCFNGGTDFFAEENSHNDLEFNEFLYSYLR